MFKISRTFLERFYQTKKENITCIGLKSATGLGTSILENVHGPLTTFKSSSWIFQGILAVMVIKRLIFSSKQFKEVKGIKHR